MYTDSAADITAFGTAAIQTNDLGWVSTSPCLLRVAEVSCLPFGSEISRWFCDSRSYLVGCGAGS